MLWGVTLPDSKELIFGQHGGGHTPENVRDDAPGAAPITVLTLS